MKIQYFKKTDTLYIEFRKADIAESRDLDEDTIIDVDANADMPRPDHNIVRVIDFARLADSFAPSKKLEVSGGII